MTSFDLLVLKHLEFVSLFLYRSTYIYFNAMHVINIPMTFITRANMIKIQNKSRLIEMAHCL